VGKALKLVKLGYGIFDFLHVASEDGDVTVRYSGNRTIYRTGDGTAWYVDGTRWRHHIPSSEVFNCLANRYEVVQVDEATVRSLPEGEAAECVTFGAGDVIRHPKDGDAYLVTGEGRRRWIPDGGTYECLVAKGAKVVPVPRYVIVETPAGPDLKPGEIKCDSLAGSIVALPEGDSHLIDLGGVRHWVPDTPTFDCLVRRGTPVRGDVPRSEVDKHSEGPWADCFDVNLFRNHITRHVDGDAHYVDDQGRAYWIPDGPTYACFERRGATRVDTRMRHYIDQMSTGEWAYCLDPATMANRVIRHPDGDAHFVNGNGQANWIPDQATWDCRMRNNGAAIEVRWRDYIDKMTTGQWDYCLDVNVLKGKILRHEKGDAHYIDAGGTRHWIPNGGVYNCLLNRGVQVVGTRWREYVDRIREGSHATC
jgi:hypothetical protein